ncbi:UDP-glycosyltransferase 82A1 [Impatiens glandulifera]|uniref:UDP-glycosyltransferase 82A1 n=1 Tax=Impatiens glandulifera TaxID=253017 RepID=UPI001FB06A51|nr:UDP-glycosyltransferase 82A1 [Impatiens glandulifera]
MKLIGEEDERPKIIMIPYPAQGHVTPMLNLASTFAVRGFRPILVIPEFIRRRISAAASEAIFLESLPDGLDEVNGNSTIDFFSIEKAMETHMPAHFESFLTAELRRSNSGGGGGGGGEVVCVVVDLLASWAIRVTRGCGVQAVGFWPAMFASYRLIAAIPEMISRRIVSDTGNPIHKGPICLQHGEPIISTEELPWLIGNSTSRASRFKFWIRTLERSRTLHCILINSFLDEERTSNDIIISQTKYHPMIISPQEFNHPIIFPVGNIIPKHVPTSGKVSLWEEDRSCLDWLDKQSPSSVVYISFGSWVNPIGTTQIKTLALALEASRRPFVWSLRHTWREGLPKGYTTRVSKQGIVVSWVPQIELLGHKSVGCYLTHCGWNSILEAIQCQKPLLCYPIAGDQFVNCAYVVDAWKIGSRLGGFQQRDVEEGLRQAMDEGDMRKIIARLNERVMGKHSSLQVNANLTSFVDSLSKCVYK